MLTTNTTNAPRRLLALMLGTAALCALCLTVRAEAGETLTLSVGDADGRPGGIAALTLRTYASRGIGQGQICVRFATFFRASGGPEGGGSPVTALLGGSVFGPNGDVVQQISYIDGASPSIVAEFTSPSGTVNTQDGPLAVFYVRLSESVLPDQIFDVEIDLQDTFLIDPDGNPIPVGIDAGRLRIRAPGEPFPVSAAAEPTLPGDIARLSMQTSQLTLLSSGQLGFRYDPSIAAGPPQVSIDPRYGRALFSIAGSQPAQGLVFVQFVSPNGSLNRVPGDIIWIDLPTRPNVPLGTESPVVLDPSLTTLVNKNGQVMPLDYEGDVLEFR